jgi:hypothetical protein
MNNSKDGSSGILQHAICHQLGHSLGLMHTTGVSCMDDFEGDVVDDAAIISNQLLQHPNAADLDTLVTLYGPAK